MPTEPPVSNCDRIIELAKNGDFAPALALAFQDVDACIAFYGDNHHQTAGAWNTVGCVHQMAMDLDRAIAAFEKAGQIAEVIGDVPMQTMALYNQGETYCVMGDGPRATAVLQRARERVTSDTDRGLVGAIISHLGWAAELVGDLDNAERLLLEGLVILHTTSFTALEAVLLERLKGVMAAQNTINQEKSHL